MVRAHKMEIWFADKKLVKLYKTGKGSYSEIIIKAFFKKIQQIRSAKNENDLRALKSNHFEKLQGIKDQYSMRLNDQFRLIIELLDDGSCKIVIIKEISNHYS